jgi:uncharacterized protein
MRERERLLGDIALKQTPAATEWSALDALTWADGALDHAWRRLAEPLQTAARRSSRGRLRPDRHACDTSAAGLVQ